MSRIPTAPIGAATFILSWGVVEITGSRPAGGLVLVAGAAWCMREWWTRRGPATAVALGAVGGIAFGASHPLGQLIGAWPAVICVAAAGGATVWFAADAPARAAQIAAQ